MNTFFNYYIQFDGFAFLLIGIIVLIAPSPQPALSKPVNEDDLKPFLQTRRLLAAMFLASALLLIVIGRNVTDLETLKAVGLARIASFLLVIIINANQYKSKRWKAAPLLVLMSLFFVMSLVYGYLIVTN